MPEARSGLNEVPPPPPPGPGEVQLRVGWCGICGTDVEEWLSGPGFIPVDAPHPITGARAPIILGHEFADVDGVVAVPAGLVPEVVQRAAQKAEKENGLRDALARGSTLRDAYDRFGVL